MTTAPKASGDQPDTAEKAKRTGVAPVASARRTAAATASARGRGASSASARLSAPNRTSQDSKDPPKAAKRAGLPRPKPSSAFLAAHKAAQSSLAAVSGDTIEAEDPSPAPRTFSNMPASARNRTEEAIFHKDEGGDGVHPKMLQQARRTGQLNLSGRGLVTVPDKVSKIKSGILGSQFI